MFEGLLKILIASFLSPSLVSPLKFLYVLIDLIAVQLADLMGLT